MTHPVFATFKALEAEARAAFTKATTWNGYHVHGSLMGIDATHDCARRAAGAHGMPWPEARAILIDHFAPRAG